VVRQLRPRLPQSAQERRLHRCRTRQRLGAGAAGDVKRSRSARSCASSTKAAPTCASSSCATTRPASRALCNGSTSSGSGSRTRTRTSGGCRRRSARKADNRRVLKSYSPAMRVHSRSCRTAGSSVPPGTSLSFWALLQHAPRPAAATQLRGDAVSVTEGDQIDGKARRGCAIPSVHARSRIRSQGTVLAVASPTNT
jgi:hypothetical protein